MRKFLCVIAFFAIAGFSQRAAAQSILDFKIVNKTGMVLYAVYVGASTDKEWGEDLLPDDVLGDGEEVDIKFTRGEVTTCKWDIKLDKDVNGKTYTYILGVDLCEVSEITFKMNDQGKIVYTKK
jgi:hypothetical protein